MKKPVALEILFLVLLVLSTMLAYIALYSVVSIWKESSKSLVKTQGHDATGRDLRVPW